MLPWLHLQNLHFRESGMEVISNRIKYFRESIFAEISTIEIFCETMVELWRFGGRSCRGIKDPMF